MIPSGNESDNEKLESVYNQYKSKMMKNAKSILKNNEDAEDAVQETFIKIAKNMDKLDEIEPGKVSAYIMAATRNTAINIYNKNKKSKSVSFSNDNIENIADIKLFDDFDTMVRYNETVKAILSLNERYREPMYFHYICGVKIKDVAVLLGRKISTVKMQIVRGKKMVQDIVNKE